MGYKHVNTIGELKELLNNFPDDTPILKYYSDMEKSGYQVGTLFNNELSTLYEDTRMCYDAFDGTPYMYTSYSTVKSTDDNKEIKGIIL